MPSRQAEYDYYVDKLHEQGFVSVEFSVTPHDAAEFFTAFRGLMAEVYERPSQRSQDIVDAFRNELPGRPHDSKGFINQRRVGQVSPYEIGRSPSTDDKDLLHWTPRTATTAHEYLRTRGGMPRAMRDLLKNCTDMHAALIASVRPVFRALGVEEILLSPLGSEAADVHMLRALHYLGKSATTPDASPFIAADELAELHLDRSKFTVAGLETKSGLVGAPGTNAYGTPNLTVEELDSIAQQVFASPIQHRPGHAKVFAGAGFYRMPDTYQAAGGNVPPLMHGVLNEHPDEERDALVLFINEHVAARGCSTPTRDETGFSDIRAFVADRQERLGGLVA